jgi:hypothetical protein
MEFDASPNQCRGISGGITRFLIPRRVPPHIYIFLVVSCNSSFDLTMKHVIPGLSTMQQ